MRDVITYCDICGNKIPACYYKQTIKYKPRRKWFDEWVEIDICENCINEIRRKAEKLDENEIESKDE